MNYQEIGEVIKDRRKSLNITQSTLAALAGVGLNTLVAIEPRHSIVPVSY